MVSHYLGNMTSWLSGRASPADQDEDLVGKNIENKKQIEKTEDDINVEKKNSFEKDIEEVSQLAYKTAKDFGNYIYSLGKNYSEQVAHKAKVLIDEKTLIGDFNKEQNKFLNQNREKKKVIDAGVPPWVGYNEEKNMKEQILELSKDKRNVMRDPPQGSQFLFDFENSFPVAMVILDEDERLKRLRFELVPKQIKEETFWRNYFYRVSLIKQSAQLTTLTSQSDILTVKKAVEAEKKKSGLENDEECENKNLEVSEFVSDTYPASNFLDSELSSAMKQLNKNNKIDYEKKEINEKKEDNKNNDEDWEKELQVELNDFEVVNEEISDAVLEQELFNQLREEDSQK